MNGAFENGAIYINGALLAGCADKEWRAHPKFEGVYMKSLLSYSDGDGRLNAMMVKIEPNCEIKSHIHDKEAELHETVYGEGEAIINGARVAYNAGVISWIASNTTHSVRAGGLGLILLAKFTPDLGAQ
jgi:quercetin dioxygenase-like cupin family protein